MTPVKFCGQTVKNPLLFVAPPLPPCSLVDGAGGPRCDARKKNNEKDREEKKRKEEECDENGCGAFGQWRRRTTRRVPETGNDAAIKMRARTHLGPRNMAPVPSYADQFYTTFFHFFFVLFRPSPPPLTVFLFFIPPNVVHFLDLPPPRLSPVFTIILQSTHTVRTI